MFFSSTKVPELGTGLLNLSYRFKHTCTDLHNHTNYGLFISQLEPNCFDKIYRNMQIILPPPTLVSFAMFRGSEFTLCPPCTTLLKSRLLKRKEKVTTSCIEKTQKAISKQ